MNSEKPKTIIIIGDGQGMDKLKDESVYLIITSPPYWQLIEHKDNRANCGQRKMSMVSCHSNPDLLTDTMCPYYHQVILIVCKSFYETNINISKR